MPLYVKLSCGCPAVDPAAMERHLLEAVASDGTDVRTFSQSLPWPVTYCHHLNHVQLSRSCSHTF